MRLGILKYEESSADDILGCLSVLLAMLSLIAFICGGVLLLNTNRNGGYLVLIGLALAIGTVIFGRGNKATRTGHRHCSGVIWDSDRAEGLAGSFVISINTSPEEVSSCAIECHAVLDLTPRTDTPPRSFPWLKPTFWIVLTDEFSEVGCGAKSEAESGYTIAGAFCDDEVSAGSVNYFKVLVDAEIFSLRGWEGNGELFANLRELGRRMAQLPKNSLEVRLKVIEPKPPMKVKKQGGLAGFSTNPAPGLVGGLAAAASGVAPVVGILAAAALNPAPALLAESQDDIEAWRRIRIQVLVFGRQDVPESDSLKSIADEFGWTICPPNGYTFPGIGGAS